MLASFIANRFAKSLRASAFSRFTTWVSTISVAIGCIALIVSVSVLSGYEETIENTALTYLSHIEVRAAGGSSIQDPNGKLRKSILQVDGIKSVEGVIVREALARTRKGVDGVVLHGVSRERFQTLTNETPGEGAFVGADLARRLNLSKGDTAVVYAADNDRDPTSPVLFSIVIDGIIRTGMQSIDESIVAMEYSALAMVLRLDEVQPSLYTCTVHEAGAVSEVATDVLATVVQSHPTDLYVITWKDRYRSIATWIELQKQPIPIILALISIVAVFTVISTLLVAVVEKAKSFAVLVTIGMKTQDLMLIVALRALRIGINGSLIGVAVALAFALIQRTWQPIALDGTIYYVSALPVSLSPLPYILVPGFAILLTLLASVVPMVMARRLNPAQLLRFS